MMPRWKFRLGTLIAAVTLASLPVMGSATEPTLSPIEKLVAQDEIRNALALYALLADGDGIKGKDTRTLADTLMAPDVVTEIFYPGAKAPLRMVGRESVAGPKPVPTPPGPTVSRHYLVETYFQEMTATTAKTITTAVHFGLSRNMIGKDCKAAGKGACGGMPERIIMWTYHMDWVKNPAGWQVRYNGLHMDN